jgi:hypothetical protein
MRSKGVELDHADVQDQLPRGKDQLTVVIYG